MIAVCISLIAGATFALFTSESGVNLAVTSAKVKVTASIDESSYYTIQNESDWTEGSANLLGSIALSEGTLSLSNWAPNDGVKFAVKVTNESTVKVLYRMTLEMSGDLAPALSVKAGYMTEGALGLVSYTSAYKTLEATDETVSLPVEVVFPDAEGINDYQGKTASISVRIEAVQGNASVSGDETVFVKASTPAAVAAVFAAGNDVILDSNLTVDTLAIPDGAKLDLNGNTLTAGAISSTSAVSRARRARSGGDKLSAIVNGKIVSNINSYALILSNDITLENVTISAASAKAVFVGGGATATLTNCTISGALALLVSNGTVAAEGCTFKGLTSYGLQAQSSAVVNATNCEVSSDAGMGLVLSSSSKAALSETNVSGKTWALYCQAASFEIDGGTFNTTSANKSHAAIKCTKASTAKIANATFLTKDANCLSIEYASDVTVTDSHFTSTEGGGACAFDNNSQMTILRCDFDTATWAISSNATDNPHGLNITVKDCEVKSASAAIMYNVGGQFLLENTTVHAGTVALFLRAGTCTVRNCEIVSEAEYVETTAEHWGQNGLTDVCQAAIIIGTDPSNNAYGYDALITIINSTVCYTDSDTPLGFAFASSSENPTEPSVAPRITQIVTDLSKDIFVIEGDVDFIAYTAE